MSASMSVISQTPGTCDERYMKIPEACQSSKTGSEKPWNLGEVTGVLLIAPGGPRNQADHGP